MTPFGTVKTSLETPLSRRGEVRYIPSRVVFNLRADNRYTINSMIPSVVPNT